MFDFSKAIHTTEGPSDTDGEDFSNIVLGVSQIVRHSNI